MWGQHLILDLKNCNDNIKSRESIEAWLVDLVDAIDMKAYGDPLIEHFATHNDDAVGFSAVQLIETSNICAHFAENLGEIYVDIFSCAEFDPQIATEVTKKHFGGEEVQSLNLRRGS